MRTAIGFAIALVGIIAAFFGGRFFAPSDTPSLGTQPINRTAVVLEIQELSRLETTRYAIEKVIPEEKRVETLFGSYTTETLLLIAYGEVIAGIDLGQIPERDIQVSGQEITVRLPSAQIFNPDSAVNDAKTYVYQREGFPFLTDKDLETKARMRASVELVRAACEAGILQSATDNATIAITRLLTPLAPTVTVIPGSVPQCPVPPAGTPTP